VTVRITRILALVGAALGWAGRGAAQDSPLSIHGLGMPGRVESVRARATGGAFAAFDPLSALVEAPAASASRLTATAAIASTYLQDDFNGTTGSRRTGRFPLFQVLGSLGHGVVAGGGFTTYLDRSYRVTISDTITLGGSGQAVTDELASDGGVTDARIILARRFERLALGAGYHLLTGSTRVDAVRRFSDTSTYRGVSQSDEIAYHGAGFSASALVTLPHLWLAGFWRSDTRLTSEVQRTTVTENDLPQTVGGAIRWQPAPDVNFAASLLRRSWASAADSNAYNTTSWSAGADIRLGLPVRFGARGGDLPFGPGGKAPREFAVAVGSGLTVSQGRAVIDFAVERLRRTTTGLTETGWTFLVGLTLRP
jgi:hypothetical protein